MGSPSSQDWLELGLGLFKSTQKNQQQADDEKKMASSTTSHHLEEGYENEEGEAEGLNLRLQIGHKHNENTNMGMGMGMAFNLMHHKEQKWRFQFQMDSISNIPHFHGLSSSPNSGLWFSLRSSANRKSGAALPQIPKSYMMSCFRLPNKLCDEIESLCANFWWGSSKNNRKAHWISWKKLCLSKFNGGLGFRDLKAFNQALLAKQSWRIVRNPDSLLAKILRGRYFPNGNFLNATVGRNPSLTWRSLVWGKDLFSKGYRWKIGNGRYVKVDEDPWLSREGSSRPVWVKDEWRGKPVSALLDEKGCWKAEAVREAFSTQDADHIINQVTGGPLAKDEVIWNIDPNGSFSVKSAYHLAIKINQAYCPSVSDLQVSLEKWKRFWKIKGAPKVKLTVWKILNNAIPTNSNITKRGIKTNPLCSLCRKFIESTEHIFWNCKVSRLIWLNFFPRLTELFGCCRLGWSPLSYWDWMAEKLSMEELEKAIIILWGIWSSRNKIAHNSPSSQHSISSDSIKWISNYIEEGQGQNLDLLTRKKEKFPSLSIWSPPPSWLLEVEL